MGASRRYAPTKSATAKAIAFVKEAGLRITAIEFPRDGAVRIITADMDTEPDAGDDKRKPEPWT